MAALRSGHDWFVDLFGFDESSSYQENRSHFSMDGEYLVCPTAPDGCTRQHVGPFETPSLGQLRRQLAAATASLKPPEEGAPGLRFEHRSDPNGVGGIIVDERNAGSVFQVASQFNCLEMVSPKVTPARGVTNYVFDKTQGPACALACPAGTVFRNYFATGPNGLGQAGLKLGGGGQLDTLADAGKLLGNEGALYWVMRNGYALPTTERSMGVLARRLRANVSRDGGGLVARAEAALRVGVHWQTSVAPPSSSKGVCQVFASALPVSYDHKGVPESDWEPLAELVLRGAYEATLCAAALKAAKEEAAAQEEEKARDAAMGGDVGGCSRSSESSSSSSSSSPPSSSSSSSSSSVGVSPTQRKPRKRVAVYLTLLGGGAFGNREEWIRAAIANALDVHRDAPLDVVLLHYGSAVPKRWASLSLPPAPPSSPPPTQHQQPTEAGGKAPVAAAVAAAVEAAPSVPMKRGCWGSGSDAKRKRKQM